MCRFSTWNREDLGSVVTLHFKIIIVLVRAFTLTTRTLPNILSLFSSADLPDNSELPNCDEFAPNSKSSSCLSCVSDFNLILVPIVRKREEGLCPQKLRYEQHTFYIIKYDHYICNHAFLSNLLQKHSHQDVDRTTRASAQLFVSTGAKPQCKCMQKYNRNSQKKGYESSAICV